MIENSKVKIQNDILQQQHLIWTEFLESTQRNLKEEESKLVRSQKVISFNLCGTKTVKLLQILKIIVSVNKLSPYISSFGIWVCKLSNSNPKTKHSHVIHWRTMTAKKQHFETLHTESVVKSKMYEATATNTFYIKCISSFYTYSLPNHFSYNTMRHIINLIQFHIYHPPNLSCAWMLVTLLPFLELEDGC